MKKIQIRLTEDELKIAESKRVIEGFKTVSEMAKRKVLEFKSNETDKITVVKSNSVPIKTFLYPHELELLKRDSKLSGMSLSREVAFRVRKTLIKDAPCLYLNELSEVKQLRTSIDKVGRNVHRIISGDRYVQIDDEDFRKEVNELLKKADEVKKILDSLINSAINRFG